MLLDTLLGRLLSYLGCVHFPTFGVVKMRQYHLPLDLVGYKFLYERDFGESARVILFLVLLIAPVRDGRLRSYISDYIFIF